MDMIEPLMHIHPLVWNRDEEDDVRALFLRNFEADARIGVYPHEQNRLQKLRFNLCVYLRPPFAKSDTLADVLDYDKLRQGILDILASGHINLLETLAERIIDLSFRYAQVCAVHLQITKLEAHADCEVGFETRRRR